METLIGRTNYVGSRPTWVNNNELKEIVEANPSQTTQELAAWLNVTLITYLLIDDLTYLQKEMLLKLVLLC